ncbi:MAG: RNA-binding S4 domain-containing protein [Bacteroidales bacterium]|nr:RNA-binding S4 domain-containing protein [Bacteroidales bacterium]
MRLDKYLWAVRLYKTRAIAAEACSNGRVFLVQGDEKRVLKPSHEVKIGEVLALNIEQLHKQIEVIAIPVNRVGAALVPNYMKDLTPDEEYERIEMARRYAFEKRDHGVGRPTKRDRRDIEEFKYK